MTTSFKSLLRDSNASLKLIETPPNISNIKVFEITIPNPKKMCFYQVFNERTPLSNAKPFKTFVLNPSLFVAALEAFTRANPDVLYYPTIVIEIQEKIYYVQAIKFAINENNDLVVHVTQDGFVSESYQYRLENMNNVEVVMNISKFPCTVLFNVLKEQNFVDWLDCTYDKMGEPNTICKSSCTKNGENEFNSNYQGDVTIKPFGNNMSLVSLVNPGQIMIYSIWDEEASQDKTPHGNLLFPITIAEFYEVQKTFNKKVKSRHLSMNEYAFRPSVVMTLKDNTGKSIDYLAVLEDITTTLKVISKYGQSIQFYNVNPEISGYPNLAMPRLPNRNFKMNMNIDALSSDQQLTFIITNAVPYRNLTKADGNYFDAVVEGRHTREGNRHIHTGGRCFGRDCWPNYGFDDYTLNVYQGSDKNSIYTLNSLNSYLGNKGGRIVGKQNGNAFKQPARIFQLNACSQIPQNLWNTLQQQLGSGNTGNPGPTSFTGTSEICSSTPSAPPASLGLMFGYWSNVQYEDTSIDFRYKDFRPFWQNPGKMDGATLNLAAEITPLYEWLTTQMNFSPKHLGNFTAPTVSIPYEKGDGPKIHPPPSS